MEALENFATNFMPPQQGAVPIMTPVQTGGAPGTLPTVAAAIAACGPMAITDANGNFVAMFNPEWFPEMKDDPYIADLCKFSREYANNDMGLLATMNSGQFGGGNDDQSGGAHDEQIISGIKAFHNLAKSFLAEIKNSKGLVLSDTDLKNLEDRFASLERNTLEKAKLHDAMFAQQSNHYQAVQSGGGVGGEVMTEALAELANRYSMLDQRTKKNTQVINNTLRQLIDLYESS